METERLPVDEPARRREEPRLPVRVGAKKRSDGVRHPEQLRAAFDRKNLKYQVLVEAPQRDG